MNEMLELIKTRRSIRSFKPDMVPAELIDQVIEAGTFAPTAKGTQSPIILAITNKEVRDQLSKLNGEIMGVITDPFYGGPVVLVVLYPKDNPNGIYDGSLVMENLMLAAHALGLGSIWIHRAKQEFERPEGQALLKSLGIEGEYEGVGHCVLGYMEGEAPAPKPRKENWVYYIK